MKTAMNGDVELLRLRAQCFYSLGNGYIGIIECYVRIHLGDCIHTSLHIYTHIYTNNNNITLQIHYYTLHTGDLDNALKHMYTYHIHHINSYIQHTLLYYINYIQTLLPSYR